MTETLIGIIGSLVIIIIFILKMLFSKSNNRAVKQLRENDLHEISVKIDGLGKDVAVLLEFKKRTEDDIKKLFSYFNSR